MQGNAKHSTTRMTGTPPASREMNALLFIVPGHTTKLMATICDSCYWMLRVPVLPAVTFTGFLWQFLTGMYYSLLKKQGGNELMKLSTRRDQYYGSFDERFIQISWEWFFSPRSRLFPRGYLWIFSYVLVILTSLYFPALGTWKLLRNAALASSTLLYFIYVLTHFGTLDDVTN